MVFLAFASSAQTMHLVLVSDLCGDIRHEVAKGQLQIFFSDICDELGITLKEYEIESDPKDVLSCLSSIDPSSDDIIIFCHCGHGCRGPQEGCQDEETDPWPYMELHRGDLPMRQVKQILESKPARLTCAFSCACNRYHPICMDDIPFTNKKHAATTTSNYKNTILALGFKQLFLKSEGHICSSAAIPGFFGYGTEDDSLGVYGSDYYWGLTSALSHNKFETDVSWSSILHESFEISHYLVKNHTVTDTSNPLNAQYVITAKNGILTDKFAYSCSEHNEKTFKISTASELKLYFEAGKAGISSINAVLIADIDMSGISLPMIPNYSAVFDGNGHTIKNLTISSTSDDENTGLFGSLSGGTVISNLILENCKMTGSQNVGAICGKNNGGYIVNCKVVDCNVTSNNTSDSPSVGGVCGVMEGSGIIEGVEVSNTKVRCSSGDVGGIVGWLNKGLVLRSKTISDDDVIRVSGRNSGGIVGSANGGSSYIWQCINNAKVYGENCAGGITSICAMGSRINQCINHGDITGQKVSGISPYVESLGWVTNSYTTTGVVSLNKDENYVTNCYMMVDSRSDVNDYARLREDFRSGFVAFRLASGCVNPRSGNKASGDSWGQHLGVDPYPVFEAEIEGGGSSTDVAKNEVHFKDNQYHNAEYQEDGTCKACDGEMIHDVDDYYLSFHALEDITITFAMNGEDFDPDDYFDPGDKLWVDLQYSVDGTDNWRTYKYMDKISIKKGQYVYFRGENSNKDFSEGEDFYYTFRTTGKFEAYGDMMSLLSYKTRDVEVPGYCFYKMFYNCKGLVTAPKIGAEELNYNCYESMFENCTSLVYVPDIRAYNLPGESFLKTFKGCTSLQRSPKMYFNVFSSGGCCKEMFANCPNLESIFAFFPEWEDGGFVDWVKNVAPSGTFYCLRELPRKYGDSNIPTNWEIKSCYDYDDGTLSGPDYLCFMGYTYMNIKLKQLKYYGNNEDVNLEYSLDKVKWNTMDYNTEISVRNFQPVYFRGINENGINTIDKVLNFSVEGDDFDVSGDIMTLINYKSIPNTVPNDYCFYRMFYGNYNMRRGPKLSATNLSAYCYRELFASTGIVELPELPAKYLDYGSYQLMCENCSSLEYVGDINVISLENSSLDEMFRECPKLTKAPKITSQYYGEGCLGQLYYRSKNVNEIVVDFESWTNSDGDAFTDSWVKDVASTGKFYCPSSLPEEYGVSRIPVGWERFPIQSAEVVIVELPYKKEYLVGEEIDLSGLKLQSVNILGKVETVNLSDCEVEYDFSEDGIQTVTIVYQEQTTSFDVTVKGLEIESISVESTPEQTTYDYGFEELDLSGLSVKVNYENGTSKTLLASEYTVSTPISTIIGKQLITVTYKDFEATFEIVVENPVASISVTTMPKNEYFQGEELDLDGGVVTVTYSNESTETVDLKDCEVSGFESDELGTQTLTVKYEDVETTFEVVVIERQITSIAVTTMPKNEYFQGEELDLDGGVVTVMYNDESTETVELKDCDVSGFKSDEVGTQTLTVKYEGFETTFDITLKQPEVVEISSIESLPNKLEYYIGDDIDLEGLVLNVKYSDGHTENVEADDENIHIGEYDNATPGTQQITVSYHGKDITFDVTFQKAPIMGLSISQKPNKTEYFVGEQIDLSGLVAVAQYANGNRIVDNTKIEIVDYDNSTPGSQVITISYEGEQSNFEVVFVQPTVVGIASVKSLPYKLKYNLGDNIDLEGLILNVKYSDGSTRSVAFDDGNMEVEDGYDNTTYGKRSITVLYQGQSTTFEVEFKEIVDAEDIFISQRPVKLEYWKGEDIDYFGMIVSARCTDGLSRDIDLADCDFRGYDANIVGEQTITVAYNGKKTTFPVKVMEWVYVSCGVYQMPNKLEYNKGEDFVPDGFVAEFIYSNGRKKYLEYNPQKCIVSGFDSEKTGVQNVTIKCYEETQETYVAVYVPVVVKEDNTAVVVNELLSIAIDGESYRDTYIQGDEFSTDGLRVSATYTNGNTESIAISDCSIYGYDMERVGKQYVYVVYAGKVATFEITVNPKPTELEYIVITQRPIKLKYNQGDDIDCDGLVVTAYNSDGSKEDVTVDCSTSGYNSNVVGKQTITVSYEGKTASFVVEVSEVALVEFEIVNTPEKVTYYKGERFENIGLECKATFSNGRTETVTVRDVVISEPDMDKPGVQKVTVVYSGKSSYFYITVNDVTIESIVVNREPYKTSYVESDDFETDGLSVSVVYSNNKTESIDIADCIIYGYDMNKVGTQRVLVSYKDKTASFDITIESKPVILESIVVTQRPIKMEYWQGDDISYDGLVVTAKYSDGSEKDITSECSMSGYDKNTVGKQDVAVKYDGKATSIIVVVKEIALVSFEIANTPDKNVYYKGDTFDNFGFEGKATYSNGKTEMLQYWDVVFSNPDMDKPGTQKVTVSYSNMSSYFYITVNDIVVESIIVNREPYKTSYVESDDFETDGLSVSAVYSNGKTESLDLTDCIIYGYDMNKVGTQRVIVSYKDKTASFEITIESKPVALESVVVVQRPIKLEYWQGDDVSYDGLVVIAKYSDGSEKEVTPDCRISGYDKNYIGKQDITVSFNGKDAVFMLEVKEVTLVSFEIVNIPEKTIYFKGDYFEKYGFEGKASYSNGKTETLQYWDVTFASPDMDKTGEQKVTVSYSEMSAAFYITVKDIEMVAISIDRKPNKTVYCIGDGFIVDGLKVSSVYNNGKKETIDVASCALSGYDMNKVGMQNVIVSYGDKSAMFEITVEKKTVVLESIAVIQRPIKLEYWLEDDIDYDGMVVMAKYSDGSENDVTSECNASGYNKNIVGKQDITISYKGETASFVVDVKEWILISIEVGNMPDKVDYYKGEVFKKDGFSCKLNYSNGKSRIIQDCQMERPDMRTIGEQKVNFSYSGKTNYFYINVKDFDVESLHIAKLPYRLTYYANDEFAPNGIKIKAIKSNGEEFDVPVSACDFDGFNMNEVGNQTVTVRYGGKSAEFEIAVKPMSNKVESIVVTASPYKTVYWKGDDIAYDGLVVTAQYQDSSEGEVTDECELYGFDKNYVGQQTITVKCYDKLAYFFVQVKEWELVSIGVESLPTKTEYTQGDVFEEYGFKGILNYSNDKSEIVSYYDCKFSIPDMNKVGEQSVTVYYKGMETSFSINVKEKEQKLEAISITKVPAKTVYDRGDMIDYTGIEVTAKYSDGSSKIVTEQCFMDGYDKDVVGLQKIVVSYTDGGITKDDTLPVSVKELTLVSMSVKSLPFKNTYLTGERFDPTGFEALFTYSNGSTDIKTLDDCEFRFYGVGNFDTDLIAVTGIQTMIASYNGQIASFNIEVFDSEELVALNVSNYKTNYYEGDVFDSEEIKIEVVKKGGDVEVVQASDCSFYGYDMNRVGTQNVIVNYKGITETYKINVVEPELVSLEIASLPWKTEYLATETLSDQGLRVMANYVNCSREIYDYIIKSPETMTIGENEVVVSYKGKSTSFFVMVNDVVFDRIEITQTPYKLDYFVNESIDYTGLIIEGVYSDGTRVAIDHNRCKKTGFDMNTAAIQTVNIEYVDNSNVHNTSFRIRVKNIDLKSIRLLQPPAKKDYYYEDKTFDLTGMALIAIYSDGNIETLDPKDCQFDGFDTEKYGTNLPITVQYHGLTEEFSINRYELQSVSVKYEPSSYSDIISVMDLAVWARYSDGTERVVENFNYVYGDDKSVSITYGDFEVKYTLKTGKDAQITSKRIATETVAKIWSFERTIIVENATSEIVVADISGHVIRRVLPVSDRIEIPVARDGVYVVRTGNVSQTVSL